MTYLGVYDKSNRHRAAEPLPDRPGRFGITRALINELDELIAAGRADHAILRVREATNLELKDATDLVGALEHGKPMPEALRYCPPPPQPPPDLELLASVVQPYLGRGKKLRAIQRVRELMGWGLDEAKAFVEGL